MNILESVFAKKPADQTRVLIPYLTGGFPSVDFTIAAVQKIAQAGADILEIGMPFSDPIADGTSIQYASHQALLNGMDIKQLFFIAEEATKQSSIPLVLMTYYNPVYQYGEQDFVKDIKTAGFHGIIVPDLPIEEGSGFASTCIDYGIAPIQMVTPLTSDERIDKISQITRGFLYCVSMPGVTGRKIENIQNMASYLKRVKRITTANLAVGFGVSSREHAEVLWKYVHGVVVGSALINIIKDAYTKASSENRHNVTLTNLYNFISGFKEHENSHN